MTGVPIRFVEGDLAVDPDSRAPGDAQWTEIGRPRLLFVCPCGCGAFSHLPVEAAAVDAATTRDAWWWNGDREKPTLKPSILNVNCGWHGWLTDGVFEPC